MAAGSLVFVAGASPQIITETVYTLAHEAAAPTNVYVLTTKTGAEVIGKELLGRGGHWQRLHREYRRARHFHLAAESIVVLQDGRGRPLEDVRSDQDNSAAADQILRFVRDHTQMHCPPLHSSIAGGRKTMGYLLAAAMMLYGRRRDRLSHVLVHPPILEGTDFYFPPRHPPRTLTCRRPDGALVKVPAADVRIDLADLPFPRLRAVKDMSLVRDKSFSTLVADLQSDLDALAAPRVSVRQDCVVCAERPVRLPPLRVEIYRLLAERRIAGCGRGECPGCMVCYVPAEEIGGPVREALRGRLRERQSAAVGPSWNEKRFREEVSRINGAIGRVLRGASDPYKVQVAGARGQRLYGLGLKAGTIEIANT